MPRDRNPTDENTSPGDEQGAVECVRMGFRERASLGRLMAYGAIKVPTDLESLKQVISMCSGGPQPYLDTIRTWTALWNKVVKEAGEPRTLPSDWQNRAGLCVNLNVDSDESSTLNDVEVVRCAEQ